MIPDQDRPRITLALSSGMWLTLGHVGAIAVLEEAGIPFDGIAGSSGGALVGALFAGGMEVGAIAQLARTMGWRDIADIRVPRMGLFSNAKLETFVEKHIGRKTFQDLHMPLAVVCCNLSNGEEVIVREGWVARAVRATCTVPQVFAPVEDNGRLLCDGGVLNKVPTNVAREMGGDIVIAVDVGYHSRRARVPTSLIGVTAKVMGLIAEDRAERERGAADVLVTPNLSGFAGFELNRSDDLISVGRAAMEEVLPQLRALIDQWHADRTFVGRLRTWWRGAA